MAYPRTSPYHYFPPPSLWLSLLKRDWEISSSVFDVDFRWLRGALLLVCFRSREPAGEIRRKDRTHGLLVAPTVSRQHLFFSRRNDMPSRPSFLFSSPFHARKKRSCKMGQRNMRLAIVAAVVVATQIELIGAATQQSLSPRYFGPLASQQIWIQPMGSDLKDCVKGLLDKSASMDATQSMMNDVCYIALPVFGTGNTLEGLLQSLTFPSTNKKCLRFNHKKYRELLWNEALLFMIKERSDIGLNCHHLKRGHWYHRATDVIALSLFWDYAYKVLTRPKISRLSSIASNFRFVRKIRTALTSDVPRKFMKESKKNYWMEAVHQFLNAPSDVYETAFTSNKRNLSSLGKLFADRLSTYSTFYELSSQS